MTGWQEGAGSRKGRAAAPAPGREPGLPRGGKGLTKGPLGSTMLKKFDKKDEESGEGGGGP